jgi:predicted metal-dependent peptidase
MSKLKPVDLDSLGLDPSFLERELDKVKHDVFMGKNSAFLGSLMSSLNFYWTTDIPTAATNGVSLMWNPHWFLSLKRPARKTVFKHELWHPGRLHFVRRGIRDPKIWNYACDIRINNDLTEEGDSFEGLEFGWRDPQYPSGMPEEDIYDDLIKRFVTPPDGPWGKPCQDGNPSDGQEQGDMLPVEGDDDLSTTVNHVVRAVQQAKLAGGAGSIPGEVETLLNKFLAPIVPWDQLLHRFMTDLFQEEYSWKRPNKRYACMPGLYMPSRHMDEGRLEHLIYYQDVSGSISDADMTRFNSEVKYVKETYNPRKMTLVQFDTEVTQEIVFEEEDSFDEIKIVGRGGTSLVPVREHMMRHRPTAAIIFSDLECDPMEKLPFEVPTIWVAIRSKERHVPFGKLVHIRG